jgi:hypothetical protein
MAAASYTPLGGINGSGHDKLYDDGNAAAGAGASGVGNNVGRSRSAMVMWYTQFQALMRKNFQVLRRQWKSTSYFIIGPILFLLLLYIVSTAIKNANSGGAEYNPIALTIDRCVSYDVYGNPYARHQNPCISIIYSPNYGVHEEIMQDVRETLGWSTYDVQGFAATDVMVNWMYDHIGLADLVINFNRTIRSVPDSPHRVSYEVH